MRLKEFLDWHLENPHNVNFKMIVAKEDREETLKAMHEISDLLDTGLTPDQIMELSESVKKVQEHFDGAITAGQIVDFYIAHGDDSRVEDAILLTNEEASRYRELKERDTAKAPEEFDGHWYKCPRCGKYVGGLKGNFCNVCGQRLKWEE